MPGSISLRLPCRPESLRELRRAVETLDQLQSAVLDDVKLVANELASNSITHSGLGERDLIEVAISSQSGHMRVDVADGGAGFTLPDEGVRRGGGRGLPMVQRLSRRFGFAHDGVTHAWAEITLA
jgi:anti-sigma regulatory factor (Ser/Thr protein kinase)